MDSCKEFQACGNHSSIAPVNEANADRIRRIDRVPSGTSILPAKRSSKRRISLGFFNAACWCRISIYMNERFRALAFAVLLIGISSVTLVQVIHTSSASVSGAQPIAPVALRDMILQSVNTTSTSNQTLSPVSTVFANSTNTTSTLETSSLTQSSSFATNQTTAISYLQYQMTSVNDELTAMSSRMDSMSQDNNTAMLIAEAGLIVAILAVVAAIAVARRADAMYKESSKDQAAGSSPPTK